MRRPVLYGFSSVLFLRESLCPICVRPHSMYHPVFQGGKSMRAVISFADDRFIYLYKILSENGWDIKEAKSGEDFAGMDTAILKYPFDSVSEAGIRYLNPKSRLIMLCAKPVPEKLERIFNVVSLTDDPAFAEENAYITAEGAIFCAMKYAPFILSKENIAVVGFGRIGRALTEMLVGLHANVTVFSRRESGRLCAMARGAQGASAEKLIPLLSDFRIIFVTSPDRMIGERELEYVSKSAFIFDLSGAPYGADIEEAKQKGIFVQREGALPGRYAPESAAKAMYKSIAGMIGGEKI